ncbi:MAG: hypothetical protein DSY89_00900 [Deltaproteobacteria bacterium]|nr:MAG: hypothetical protein DSY89_00900 [Deltaproteobacteria bacterium]
MAVSSNAFPIFFKHLESRLDTRILDIGPVCGDNITLLARKVRQLYICDIFARIPKPVNPAPPSGRIWRHLDYEPDTFDGILIWNLLDRLDSDVVGNAGNHCRRILKPGGLVVAYALGEKELNAAVHAFVLSDSRKVSLRSQPHLDLALHTRTTRRLVEILAPLKLVQSSLFRNGLREFLFKKDVA